jgi:hypothetical protein
MLLHTIFERTTKPLYRRVRRFHKMQTVTLHIQSPLKYSIGTNEGKDCTCASGSVTHKM